MLYDPLISYLQNLKLPTVQLGTREYIHEVDIGEEGQLESKVHKTYNYTWPDEVFEEIDRIMRDCQEKEKWQKEAERQVYIANAKKEILAGEPPEDRQVKMVAVNICPPPEHADPESLQKIIKIIQSISKKTIQSGFYVFEQRSQGDEEEHGWHVHMSVDTTYAPAKIKQFIQQKLQSRGYTWIWKYALVCRQDDGGFREGYMRGDKNHADKDPKVKKDIILRQKYNLQDYYQY